MSATTLRLYEAADALETVREWVSENEEALIAAGGDLTQLPELASLIDQAEGDFKSKVESVALYVRELLSTADAISVEAKRLSARASAKTRAAEGLKAYLLHHLVATDTAKVEGTLVTVRVQKSPPAIQCSLDDAALESLYADWWRQDGPSVVTLVPASYRVNAAAVKALNDLKAPLPPGITITQGKHVRIA